MKRLVAACAATLMVAGCTIFFLMLRNNATRQTRAEELTMTEHAREMVRHSYRLAYDEGRPVILDDQNERIQPAAYCDCQVRQFDKWVERNRAFAESGVHLYFLTVVHDWGTNATAFWIGDGDYPFATARGDLEDQARAILAFDAQARFYVRFGDSVPKKWANAYSDEMQLSSTGVRMNQISPASAHGLDAFKRYVADVVRYCESRDWTERIVGYMYFPHGEGLTELATNGYVFDQSPAMQEAFRDFTRERYANAAAVSAAWGEAHDRFASVRVPTDQEWSAKRARSLHWPEPALMRRERDYFALQQRLFRRWTGGIMETLRTATAARPVLLGIDAFKQPMIGWQLTLAFGRKDHIDDPMCDYPEMTLPSGATAIADILDQEGWDIVITPSDYTARSMGFGWESEGVNDSLRLRNKAMLVENDARTWVGAEAETLGAFLTPAEVRAGLLRNTAWVLTRGHLHYWMVVGSWYFDDPQIHEIAIRTERKLINAARLWPHRETADAICLVIDDSSPMHEDGTAGYQQIANLWQRHLGLAHCGVPYRVYLLSDLDRAEMPRYKTYLFPNLFQLDEARLAMLKRTVLRNGNVVILGPATGITDGHALGAAGISTLLDMPFELIRKQAPRRVLVQGGHPLTARLPASLTYGDSYPYGPILVPTRAAVTAGGVAALGRAVLFWEVNKPGLILKEFGAGAAGNGQPGERGADDYALVWSAAMPLPAGLLRECARWAGSCVWCEEDDVILASDTVAAVHTVKPGRRTLRFPTPRPVWDLLSGEKLGDALTEVALVLEAPETRLFYFGETDPFAE